MNSASSANHDKIQQESIPEGCVLPAHHRTGGFSVQRGLPDRDPAREQRPPGQRPPRLRPSWTETPLGLPLEETRNQSARLGSDITQRPPIGQTDTLPQTLLMGGKMVWLPDVLCI